MSAPTVAVVGAGMAGLAAAWRLTRAGAEVVVLDRDERVGGRVRTWEDRGFTCEAGAGFLTNFYDHTLQLVRDLGLEPELRAIGGGAAVLRAGRLRAVWPQTALLGGRLLEPREALALLRLAGPLLRFWPSLDLHAPERARLADDESVAGYARRRLGGGLLDYLIEPPLGGVLYWTPERTSMGMLLVAVRAGLRMRRLLTLRGGLGTLPDAIARKLEVRLGARVHAIRADGAGHELAVRFDDRRERLVVDAVVCATPAPAARRLLDGLHPAAAAFLDSVAYASTVVATVATGRRLRGPHYGLLFPRAESRHLGAASIASAGLPDRAPPGHDLLTLYASGAGGRRLLAVDDREALAALLADARQAGVADLAADTLFHRVHRWQAALPEFPPGQLRRLAAFLDQRPLPPTLALAGDYLGGPSIEGAVTSGFQAADQLLAALGLAAPREPAAAQPDPGRR